MAPTKRRSSCGRRGSSSKVSPFGGGVAHAIKKPSKKKIQAEKEKKEKAERAAAAKIVAERRRQSASAVAGAATTPTALRSLQVQTVRAGSLTSNVGYVLKNGQVQFTRRTSPRKNGGVGASPYSSSPVPARKTPAKLFTPSGSKDYLNPSPTNSPVARKRLHVPSPVKFQKENEDGPEMESDVSGILEQLDEDVEGAEKENDYRVVASEDELSQMAWQAAQEIEELRYEDSSDLEDDGPTTTKTETASAETEKPDNEQEVYSIFKKNSAKSGLKSSPSKKSPRKSPRKSSKLVGSRDRNQMLIDAGQKNVGGNTTCPTCRFPYARGDAEEEKLHDIEHRRYKGIVDFAGWKNERLALQDEAEEWRVVAVKPSDTKRHWEKVKSVVEIVDTALGITGADAAIRQPSKSRAYLMVREKRVVGLLLAEPLMGTDQVERSFLKGQTRVVAETGISGAKKDALVGVSRIWVHHEFHRMGYASKLMEALRGNYCFPVFVEKSDLAFTHTTDLGAKFAAAYMGKKEFLVYRQNNDG